MSLPSCAGGAGHSRDSPVLEKDAAGDSCAVAREKRPRRGRPGRAGAAGRRVPPGSEGRGGDRDPPAHRGPQGLPEDTSALGGAAPEGRQSRRGARGAPEGQARPVPTPGHSRPRGARGTHHGPQTGPPAAASQPSHPQPPGAARSRRPPPRLLTVRLSSVSGSAGSHSSLSLRSQCSSGGCSPPLSHTSMAAAGTPTGPSLCLSVGRSVPRPAAGPCPGPRSRALAPAPAPSPSWRQRAGVGRAGHPRQLRAAHPPRLRRPARQSGASSAGRGPMGARAPSGRGRGMWAWRARPMARRSGGRASQWDSDKTAPGAVRPASPPQGGTCGGPGPAPGMVAPGEGVGPHSQRSCAMSAGQSAPRENQSGTARGSCTEDAGACLTPVGPRALINRQ